MNEFKNKQINYTCFIIICSVYNMLYTIFYLDLSHSQNAALVHIVQLFLRVVNWVTFLLRESGIQNQTQPMFTCYLNIWIMPLECAKGRQVAVVGRSWETSTRIYLGDKKRGKGRQKTNEIGILENIPILENMVTRNGEKYNHISNSIWLPVIWSLTVLVKLSLDLERHSKIL